MSEENVSEETVTSEDVGSVEEVLAPAPQEPPAEEKADEPAPLGVNELYFRKGDKVKVEGFDCPMVVDEVRGLHLTLKRVDIK